MFLDQQLLPIPAEDPQTYELIRGLLNDASRYYFVWPRNFACQQNVIFPHTGLAAYVLYPQNALERDTDLWKAGIYRSDGLGVVTGTELTPEKAFLNAYFEFQLKYLRSLCS